MQESVSGYADVPLAFYVALAIFNLWYYINKGENLRLWLGCVFAGLAMWVKNEGIGFWLAVTLSLILAGFWAPKLFKQKKKMILAYAFIPWLIFSPWVILRLIFNIRNEIPFKTISTLFTLLIERSTFMFKALTLELFNVNRWNISWIIFMFSVIFSTKAERRTQLFLSLLILLQAVFFVSVFIFGPSSFADMLAWSRSSIHRPLLQLYPIALFFIAQNIGKYIEV